MYQCKFQDEFIDGLFEALQLLKTKEEYKVTLDDLISFLDDRIGDEHEEI